MKYKKITSSLKAKLQMVVEHYPLLSPIIQNIHQKGGTVLLVGGAVRDLLLKLPIKDLDIEVHSLSLAGLEAILKKFGPVSLVGKSFGVLRLHGLDIDWSLPRSDSAGRKPKVALDPFMSVNDAFRRRDITMNAMGIDLTTYELIDPFDGQEDLKKKVLRAPDTHLFIEDPLRFYRVMQFIGRFEMLPDKELDAVCKKMNLKEISIERISDEFEKLFLKSKRPSLAFKWLDKLGRLEELLPELAALQEVPQEPSWHPEGDVWEHTMQAIDAAAAIECETQEEKLILMIAALCHDLGKVVTTKIIDGKITSRLHEIKGLPIAKRFLKRITKKKELIDTVLKLIRYHMTPGMYIAGGTKMPAYKKLARNLAPHTNLQMLANLAFADKRGRNPDKGTPLDSKLPDIEQFLKKAEEAQVLLNVEQPVLLGRDLMPEIKPGPMMGQLLKKAYEIQIDEGIKDKGLLKKRVLKKAIK